MIKCCMVQEEEGVRRKWDGCVGRADCKIDSLLSKIEALFAEHVTCEFITYR
jgi:hypothetical protein